MESNQESGVETDEVGMTKMLSFTEFGFDLLQVAVEVGSVNIVTALMKRRCADIDRCDDKGWTLLQTAVHNGHEEVVKTLIRYGANVNSNGTHEETTCNRLQLCLLSPT